MTREELGQSLNLIEDIIPKGNRNRKGRRLSPTKIAIHNTGNKSKEQMLLHILDTLSKMQVILGMVQHLGTIL